MARKEYEVFIMSRKINVKAMDIESLSNYNVASFEILRLTAEKNAELKPLKDERTAILEARKKDLEDGMALDEVLKKHSLDLIDSKIASVNFKYIKPMQEATKAQNKVLKLVNPNTFYAYVVSMDSMDSMFNATGEYKYEKKNGEIETIKIGSKDTFAKCIKKLYEDLGALGLEDEKAMDKVVKYHAKRVGGLKFDRKSQNNVLKKKSEIQNGLVRDVINYLVARGVVTVAEDGTITRA